MSDRADFARLIGERICLARTEAGLSQEALAEKLGLNDRQTVSAIEAGKRAVTAEELVKLSALFSRPLDFFTDPHRLVEKGEFSYRTALPPAKLAAFEETARRLLDANHRFRQLLDEPSSPIVGQLREATPQITPEYAGGLGHQLARTWALGECPAARLGAMIESHLHVAVLAIDAPVGLSGVACRLSEGDVILINRREPAYRRNWTLAHELFHLLTWEAMPPERIDPELPEKEKPKVEKLADAFAAGLLMPVGEFRRGWESTRGELHSRVLQLAERFQVSGSAASYRLINLGILTREQAAKIDPAKLTRKKTDTAGTSPPVFSAEFVRRLHTALDRGLVTVRLAADLLDTEPEELKSVFHEHSREVPFEL